MIIINNNSISHIDSSLNSYEEAIESAHDVAGKSGVEYSGEIAGKFSAATGKKKNISTFLQGLTFTQVPAGDDIRELDISYTKFRGDLLRANQVNEELKKVTQKYEINKAQLENAKQTKTYTTLMVWIIIFMFVSSALFMSIIEDKKQMNIFSKIILMLFLLVIVFYVTKNLLTNIK